MTASYIEDVLIGQQDLDLKLSKEAQVEDEESIIENNENDFNFVSLLASGSYRDHVNASIQPLAFDDLEISDSQSPSSRTEFTEEMQKSIGGVVHECIYLYNKDPQEYHLFYLTVQKFLDIGRQHDYIPEGIVDSIWKKCDDFASKEFDNWKESFSSFDGSNLVPSLSESLFEGDFPATSQLQEVEAKCHKFISEHGHLAQQRKDLKTRLNFFKLCKSITQPNDMSRMNYLWGQLLSPTLTPEEDNDDILSNLNLIEAEINRRAEEDEDELFQEMNCLVSELVGSDLLMHSTDDALLSGVDPSDIFESLGEFETADPPGFETDLHLQLPRLDEDSPLCSPPPSLLTINYESDNESLKEEHSLLERQTGASTSAPVTRVKVLSKDKRECNICRKTYASAHSLNIHRKYMHKPSSTMFKCPHCRMEFKKEKYLWLHFEKIHISQKSSKVWLCCDKCGKEFSSEFELNKHVKEGHPVRKLDELVKCRQCDKSFKQKSTLDDHIRRVHEGKGFFCDLCPGRGDLQTAGKLWKHKIDKHGLTELKPPPGVVNVVCEFCGKKMLRGLLAHVRNEHPEKLGEFQMPDGDHKETKGKTSDELGKNEGILVRKSDNRSMLMQCPKCLKEIQIGSMDRHLRNVHGFNTKRFPCPTCGKQFKEKYHLKEHVRDIHDEIQERLVSSKLIKHLPSNPRRPASLKCALCDKQFMYSFQIRAHLISDHPDVYVNLKKGHLPEIQLKCGECFEEFVEENELLSHVKLNHANECWRCSKCSKVLLTSFELKEHLRCEHNEKEDRTSLFSNLRLVSCELCSRQVSVRYMPRHYKACHQQLQDPWRCQVCDKTILRPDHWVWHMYKLHSCPTEELLQAVSKLRASDRKSFQVKENGSKRKGKCGADGKSPGGGQTVRRSERTRKRKMWQDGGKEEGCDEEEI